MKATATRRVRAKTVWTPERIKALRKAYGEKQDEFCERLRVKVHTLRFWEQGNGEPSGPATVVLDMLEAQLARRDIPSLVN